ncbi:SRPBCC family protein [Allosphingosinicella sp.]|uniref:SRPBCC family protein n=1 Tax=Allosphingosinicella sp. TaxID=2823234 RepID=UPI002FC1866D
MTEIILIVLVILAALLIYIMTRPNTFRVRRSAMIDAPPEKVFPLINDFHRWEVWSPWEKLDPALQRRFSGPESGKGSIYEWQGNKKVGQGRMEIVDSFAPSKILIKLDFLKPFESHNTTEFTLEPKDRATEVNWEMYGPSPFMTKAMSLFGGMDKMVGKDFEKGLANMRAAAEGTTPEAVPPPR